MIRNFNVNIVFKSNKCNNNNKKKYDNVTNNKRSNFAVINI